MIYLDLWTDFPDKSPSFYYLKRENCFSSSFNNSPKDSILCRFADSKHPFADKLERCRTTSFANAFVPMTWRSWNSLPASTFPDIYNNQNPGAHTPTPTPFPLIIFLFTSVLQGSIEIHRGCIFLESPFLHSIPFKKMQKLRLDRNMIF